MLRRPPVLIAALIAAATLTACAASQDAQPSSRSVSPTAVAPPTSTPGTTPPGTTPPSATPASPPQSPRDVVPPSPPSTGSGIAGRTVTDGGCPIARAEPPCPDRPVPAHLNILDAATGTVVASVDSGADGGFVLALKPGRYLLRPTRISGAPPHRPTPATVTVKPGLYTTVNIRFDSGIR